jgi:O-antigen ligase
MLSFFAFVGFRRNTHAVFNIRNYLLASVILFLCFVVFRVQYYFAFIIEQLLNRSLDFTYRTGIWDAALIRIRQNPIFGRGYFIEAINPLGTQTSAHNAVLSILLFGGFAALIVLLLILLSTSKKLMRYRNANISMILSTTLFVYTLQMLTEARIHFFFFALLVLANKIEMLLPLESQSAPQTIAASVKQFRTSSHNVR